MGDLPGKFPGRRASEDKARREDSCWPVGTVVESDKQPLQVALESINPYKGRLEIET